MSQIIFYLTPDHKELQIIERDALASDDTPAMIRFAECALASRDAGFDGFEVDIQSLLDGTKIISWRFKLDFLEGQILSKLYHEARAGVVPPTPEDVVVKIRRANG